METLAIPKQIHPIPFSLSKDRSKIPYKLSFLTRITTIAASSSSESGEWTRRRPGKKMRKRLVTISTSGDGRGRGKDKCTSDYVFSLEQLRLGDLAEDGHRDALVFITLAVDKHASFGFSVHGRIITLLNRKCINCSCSYCREIDTAFDVWVLPSSRKDNRSMQLGGDDPSVIYVKPGADADLDSLIQDTIRLTASVKETCSEICEKSEQFSSTTPPPVVDARWSTLLKLKNRPS